MDRAGYHRRAVNMLGWIFGWYRDKYYNYVVPDGFQVHHIDRDYTNNSLDNVVILTVEEHMKVHEEERNEILQRYDEKISKSILCIETGIIYESVREAGRQTGIPYENIGAVCRGKRKTAGGFHWEYVDDEG